jgi:hypothetical protein
MEAGSGLTAIETNVAAVPVPLSDTFCGLLFAESLKLRVPERVPVALGENVTEAEQLAPPAKVAGQAELTEKSARLLVTELIVSDADWLLVRVTVFAELLVPRG